MMFKIKVMILLVLFITLVVYFNDDIETFHFKNISEEIGHVSMVTNTRRILYKNKTFIHLLRDSFVKLQQFNITGNDVIVFLHIQKTGGTAFGKILVRNLVLERKCEKIQIAKKSRFMCKRPGNEEIWLYSRYSTGWVCGLHADWTTWHDCLPNVLKSRLGEDRASKTRLFYITILRKPVERFLSEYKHVQRGATWMTSIFTCNNKIYTVSYCFKGSNWSNVKLSEFLGCSHNLAFNRQTRMLANLTEVGCYNSTEYYNHSKEIARMMLKTAKQNLLSMAYFALLEYQRESQYLFEKTFGLQFKRKFFQMPVSETLGGDELLKVSTSELLQIRKVTRLDRQLYSFAKTIFFKRLKYYQKLDKFNEP
ncbi:heparan-sulfate 6-O-sulfotransferase 1-like [Xenia sp. Carnegie-2017]|uniref:heparan-sulfate 6-O-sulfotransferase 1-like n=1 Tax=Xenia sp. Carnegie-2017 TaxID=2897299 RepID=UPI001F038EFB|nr:heparan-sulfate 6-O-sulfotransferase 1-like [Xenia sp. Carnegie-2017]